MKSSFLEQLNRLRREGFRFLQISLEYAKLTAAEKLTILSGMLALGVISLAVLCFVFLFLGFTCAELFKMILSPALAYLCTAGVFLIFCILLYLVRNPLILTPISRMMTKLLFDQKQKTEED